MALLDSYLKAVGLYLPKRQKNDIVRELSENILSAMEEREAALGRALTEAEQAETLTRFGDPSVVARSYKSTGGHHLAIGWELIGPELFPTFRLFLIFNLAVALITTVIIALLLHVPLTVRLFAIPVIAQVVILTIVFTGINFFRSRFRSPWIFGPPALAPWQPVARWSSATGLVMWSVFTFWLLAVPHFPFLLFGPAAAGLKLGTAWLPFYAPMLGLLGIGITQRAINLAHPEWSFILPFTRVIVDFAALALQIPISQSFPWVTVADGDPSHYGQLAQNFNIWIQYGVFGWLWIYLLINGTIYAWLCMPHIRRFLREHRAPVGQALRPQH